MEIFINSLIAYLIIIDPLGMSIFFSTLTTNKSDKYVRQMAVRAYSISIIIVLIFGLFGSKLLVVLGIHIYSFKIAGGLLLFYTAFHMITKPDENINEAEKMVEIDISVYPLTIPMMAGPGALTMTILLFSNVESSASGTLLVALAAFIVYTLTLLCFFLSKKIKRVVGISGNNIIKRLVGVLLASLSVQFIVDGIIATIH